MRHPARPLITRLVVMFVHLRSQGMLSVLAMRVPTSASQRSVAASSRNRCISPGRCWPSLSSVNTQSRPCSSAQA